MSVDTTARTKDVVLATFEAMGRSDIAGMVEHLADDVVWEIMGGDGFIPGGRRYEGKGVVANDLLSIIPQLYVLDTIRLNREFVYTDGEAVIIEFTCCATATSGQVNDGAAYVWVHKVRDGKIYHAREYVDTLKLKGIFFAEGAADVGHS